MNKGEITRQRIIETAAPLFNQRGFEGCSIQDILDATGLEKGCLYRHFASKEELAAEAFRYALATVVKVRTHSPDQVEGSIPRLRYIIKRFAEGPPIMPGGCPLMNVAIDADDGNPVLRQLAREGIHNWKSSLCNIVEDGVSRGEIRNDVEPRRVANTIIATLEGALMISRIEGTKQAVRGRYSWQAAPRRLMSLPDGLHYAWERPRRSAYTGLGENCLLWPDRWSGFKSFLQRSLSALLAAPAPRLHDAPAFDVCTAASLSPRKTPASPVPPASAITAPDIRCAQAHAADFRRCPVIPPCLRRRLLLHSLHPSLQHTAVSEVVAQHRE